MGGTLSVELQSLIDRYSVERADRLWDDAIEQADAYDGQRGTALGGLALESGGFPLEGITRDGTTRDGIAYRGDVYRGDESAADRVRRLRDKLAGDLVAFHEHLLIGPYTGGDLACAPGRMLWQIGVPLTLFPKRDHGFSRLECMVELRSDAGPQTFRVVGLRPADRDEVVGKLDLGGKLDLSTHAKLGLSLPLLTGGLVSDATLALYGTAEAQFSHELRRVCALSEIVEGIGGRWRLDDAGHPGGIVPEGHQLALIIEAERTSVPLHLTGVLQAYSDVHWLTSTLGSAWDSFKGKILAFFNKGAPVEAVAEWRDIVPAARW